MPSWEPHRTDPPHMPCPEGADSAAQLARACSALWLATLSLMTAYMQMQAPAHRLLLARRIAHNLQTLSRQECFAAASRERFARLAVRWEGHGRRLQPQRDPSQGGHGLLDTLRQLTRQHP